VLLWNAYLRLVDVGAVDGAGGGAGVDVLIPCILALGMPLVAVVGGTFVMVEEFSAPVSILGGLFGGIFLSAIVVLR
jgi:hypothetical protein